MLTAQTANAMYRQFSVRVASHPGLIRQYLSGGILKGERILLDRHLKPGRALDMGFGAGRLLLHLYSKGQRVFGVDNCPEFVASARRNFTSATLACGEMQKPETFLPQLGVNEFDNLVCLGMALGGLFSVQEQAEFTAACRRLAAPGGRLFVDRIAQPIGTFVRKYELFGLTEAERESRGFIGIIFDTMTGVVLAQYYPEASEVINLFTEAGFALLDSRESFNRGNIYETFVFERQPTS